MVSASRCLSGTQGQAARHGICEITMEGPLGRRERWGGEGELLPPPGLTFSLGAHTSFRQQLPASQHSPGSCGSRRAGGGRPGVSAGV